MTGQHVRRLLELYPKIFHACHTQHVHEPTTGMVLSASQAALLDHLDEVDPTNLAGLARHAGVTSSTMSIAVERLVRKGLVTRTRDAVDGRRVELRLTPAGARMREANSVLDAGRVRAMLQHLSEPDLARALDGLVLLAHAAEAEMPNRRLHGLEHTVHQTHKAET